MRDARCEMRDANSTKVQLHLTKVLACPPELVEGLALSSNFEQSEKWLFAFLASPKKVHPRPNALSHTDALHCLIS